MEALQQFIAMIAAFAKWILTILDALFYLPAMNSQAIRPFAYFYWYPTNVRYFFALV